MNWDEIWFRDPISPLDPDWSDPETFFACLKLLLSRGEEVGDFLVQLAGRTPSIAELAGEKLIVDGTQDEQSGAWCYRVLGLHTRRLYTEIEVAGCGADKVTLELLVPLIRMASNGLRLTSIGEREALGELVDLLHSSAQDL